MFLSANKAFVEKLAEGGREGRYGDPLCSRTPRPRGQPQVRRRRGWPCRPDKARGEARRHRQSRVAPYGLAAKQALERSGLASVTPKLVQGESVRIALQFVQTGNAEVGLVAHSAADVPEVRRIDLDRTLYDPVVQYLGIVSRTENSAAARKFADFLLGDEGQALFVSFGFVPNEQPSVTP